MKVYGTGLPRTGTTSLSKALEILGYEVVHYCPITNPNTLSQLRGAQHEAYVSSEFLLNADLTRDVWILLHRESWVDSMWNLGQDICQWQSHIDSWNTMKSVVRENILHFSIADGWQDLCAFLGKPTPSTAFPFVNAR